MYRSSIQSKALLLLAVFWNDFLPWYVVFKPIAIVKDYCGYAKVFWKICSFVFLLKTLFAPWKNIGEEYPENMFDLARVFQAFSMNIVARGVGFVVRLLTIAFGILLEALLLIFYVSYFILWLSFPFILVLSVPYILGVMLS